MRVVGVLVVLAGGGPSSTCRHSIINQTKPHVIYKSLRARRRCLCFDRNILTFLKVSKHHIYIYINISIIICMYICIYIYMCVYICIYKHMMMIAFIITLGEIM